MLYWRLMCECVCVCVFTPATIMLCSSVWFFHFSMKLLFLCCDLGRWCLFCFLSLIFLFYLFLAVSPPLLRTGTNFLTFTILCSVLWTPHYLHLNDHSTPHFLSFLVLPAPPLPFRLALKHSVGSSFADLHADKTLAPCKQSDKEQLRGLFHCRMLAGYPELKVWADQSFDCSCLSPSGGSLSHFLILPL